MRVRNRSSALTAATVAGLVFVLGALVLMPNNKLMGGVNTAGAFGLVVDDSSTFGGEVLVVGDGVALAAEPCLTKRRATVVASYGQTVQQSVEAILRRRAAERLPERIVVQLGSYSNGPGVSHQEFEDLMEAVGPGRIVGWAIGPDSATRTVRAISMGVGSRDDARILDWSHRAQIHPDWFAADGTSLTTRGCDGYARTVDRVIRSNDSGDWVPVESAARRVS